jgi:RNA polymerase sigma-70 factor (ECF subfamily)
MTRAITQEINPSLTLWAGRLNQDIAINSDTQLLERARTLDPQALGQIYDAYFERLYRYAFHFVDNPALAQDIAAEALRRLLEALHKRRGPEHLSVWLYRVAHNLAIDAIRKQPPGAVVALDLCAAAADGPGTEAMMEQHLQQDHIRAALAQLTPDQRQVLILKFLEGYSNAEIGALINKPEGAIKSLQHRALAALRKALGKDKEALRQ